MQCNKVSIAIWVNFFSGNCYNARNQNRSTFSRQKKMFSTSFSIFSWNCTIFCFFTFTQNHSFFDGHFLDSEKVREMGPFQKFIFVKKRMKAYFFSFFFICPPATLWDFQKTFFSISCKNALLRKLLSIAWRLKSSQLSFSSFCRLNLWTTMKTTRNFV